MSRNENRWSWVLKDTAKRRRGLHFLARGLRDIRSVGLQRLLLGAGYGASILTTVFCIVWLIVAGPGKVGTKAVVEQGGLTIDYLVILICLNLVLLLTLMAFVIRRLIAIARSRGADAGARLHLRFVFLFSLAAVAPATIVALMFGFLSQGLNTFYAGRFQTTVENGAQVAQAYVAVHGEGVVNDITSLQHVFDLPEARALFQDRVKFSTALQENLDAREHLSAVYIIDRHGQILARAEKPNAPPFVAPSQSELSEAFAKGGAGSSGVYGDRVSLLLEGYGGAVIYGAEPYPPGFGTKLAEADKATQELRDVMKKNARNQAIFFTAYFEAVLLVLIGAIWGGTSAAESIAVPVARVVQAAGKVAAGDLSARVMTTRQSEDIAVLSRAFNRMTSDLQSQQTELKAAGEEAESRRRFIETVLSEISAGIVGLDEHEQVSAINRHAANFLGVTSSEAISLRIRELAPEIVELLDKVSVHRVEEQEVDLVRRGETRRVRVRISGLETGGAVLTFDDITRLIAAQRNAAWKDVARRIAHEIKNPLTPIQLSAERLRKKYRGQITTDVETFDRLNDTIIRQVGDIGRMVDEFSSFARMPAPNFAEEEAAELVRSCVFSQRVTRADIAIEIVEPLPEIKVVCDGRMLGQALGNVLKNGGEAISSRLMRDRGSDAITPADGIVGHLRVEMHLEEGFLVIEVEDDGIGLPEKDRDRLTEPYVTTREKGTGLGLAIVKRILEDHGGEFYLNDAVYLSGARAVLRLPRYQVGVNLPATDNSGLAGAKLLSQKMVRS